MPAVPTPRLLWSLSLASGVLLGWSYPPGPGSALAAVAWIPLLWVWSRTTSVRRMLLHAWAAWLATYAVAFAWPLAHVRADTAWLSLNGLLLLPLVLGLPPALAVAVRRARGEVVGLAALAAFQLGAEALLSLGPLAFPWSLLGHTQAASPWVAPLAALAGVPGLTLWLLALNIAGYRALTAATRRGRWRSAAAMLAVAGAGLATAASLRTALPPPRATVPVGFVQPAIPAAAWARVRDTTRAATLLAMSDSLARTAPQRPALMVWPETALPVLDSTAAARTLLRRLQAWVDSTRIPLLTGAITLAPDAPHLYRNSALLLQPGRSAQQHDKIRLVPLAEYVPFSEERPGLQRLAIPAGGVRGYAPGRLHAPLRLERDAAPPLRLGVFICLESLFGNYARRYHEQEADVLITLAQVGWWGDTAGHRQHLAFTRLRAIETGRAMLVVTVSGRSALIRPDGRSVVEAGWMERTARLVAVPVYDAAPPYARYGGAVHPLALVAALTALGLIRRPAPRPTS
ncbi:MAG: apolipoprotein N-acyltransferase [Bacteroidetes bacterium]|nr:MAG: apolipoprotein N-acyltransferase [Bacteroidota bacterium]